MRVLFLTYPEKPVFHYLVGLAWALRGAGHDIVVGSQANFAGVVTGAGLTALPLGDDRPPWRITNITRQQRQAERAGIPPPYDVVEGPEKATWEHLHAGYAGPVVNRYVMESLPMIDDAVAFSRRWQPDLVIWESNCFAGPIAAAVSGAAHARILFGIDVFGLARERYLRLRPRPGPPDPVARWFGARLEPFGHGFSEDMVTGQFTIDQFPASLQISADLPYLRMRYPPYGGAAVVPGWLREPPARPRVALTMGLSATEHFDGYPIDLQDVLDGLADLDVELVATIAEAESRKLRRVPRSARLVPYVPLHALAPTCSAVIHHAGAATLATTSLFALPQLAVHHHYDQPILARLLARQGAGIALAAEEATGATVRARVEELLGGDGYHQAAVRLRDEIYALPTPNDIVAGIEDLTRRYRRR